MIPTLGIYGIQDQGTFPAPRWTHDHGVALFVDGRLEWALELERYTRRKHDNRLHLFLEQLIEEGVLPLPDHFRIVAVDSLAGRAFLSSSGKWRIEGNYIPLPEGTPLQPARAYVGFEQVEAFHCFQELAHPASNLPFTGGFEENSLLVHLDGGASQSNTSAFLYKDGRITYVYHSWETLFAVLNFGYNQLTYGMLGMHEDTRMAAPGKLMGYAAYGQDTPGLRAWLHQHDWFRKHLQAPEQFFKAAREDFSWHATGFDLHDQLLMNIAACCQAEFEEHMLTLLTRLRERTGATRLYAAGGATLNVELNRKLLASRLFDEVFIPPCCSDCGLAIGAAALAEFLDRGSVERHAPFLNNAGLFSMNNWRRPVNIKELGDRLERGQVVAVCTDTAEVGPRALGHRSLLASPADVRSRTYLSETIKRREWYRPVAPVVLEELADELFPGATGTTLTDFMLCNVFVHPDWRDRIPAVVHVDGTARVQVVRKDAPEQDLLQALLHEVWESHQLPCLINTSFNGPGEPIVHTASQAIETAQRLGVDVLVIDDLMETYTPFETSRW
jgi:carbamoyltransferase